MRSVVLALGSNVGDSGAILQGAVDDLAAVPGLELTAVSRVYETDAIGGPEQPAYLNAVVIGQMTLDPGDLLDAVHRVEGAWHRTREVRWGPRTLDVDVIAIDDERSDDPHLTLPHPRAHERAFVLVPWLDVDASAALAGRGQVSDLLARIGSVGVRPTERCLRLPDPGEGPSRWTP